MPKQLITSAGITAVSNTITSGSSIQVIGYKIGSRSNFTPVSTLTDVDTQVFPSTGISSSGLTFNIGAGTLNQVLFRIVLDPTLGNFDVGNIGLFIGSISNPILLAIVTLDAVNSKTKTVGNTKGNILTYDLYVTLNDITTAINNSLTTANTDYIYNIYEVLNESSLPNASTTNLKDIVIQSHSLYNNKPVIAHLDTSWKIITSVLTDTALNVTTPANESTLLGASRQAIAEAISNVNVNLNDATISARGSVELATNTETQTGTDAVRAVTPAGLASLTATASRRGLIELATQTEVDTGTDTSRAVTPATLNSYVDDEIGSNITDSDLNVSTPANESISLMASRQSIAEALNTLNQNVNNASISNASLTVKGIIELATDAEANTGTDSSRAVVPSSLKYVLDNRNASATKTGLIELATQTEVDTGTDTSRAVTPATLNSYVDDAIGSNITDSDLNVSTPANESTTIAPSRQVVAETINSNLNDASVSQKGFVELATNTETQTGTDAVRAVTPASLASLTATASRRGLIELATQTEVDNADNERLVTPDLFMNLFSSNSIIRNSSIDYDTLSAAGNNDPRGIYSDGETTWVVDSTDVIVYAYESDSKNRKSSLDITNSVLTGAGNSHPYGITGNRYGILYVSDTNDNKIYSYSISSGAYISAFSYNLDSLNTNCADIHLDERRSLLYVTDTVDDKVYSYTTSGKEVPGSLGDRVESLEIDLVSVNSSPRGIWSDGTYIWVVDSSDRKLYAYNLSTGNRETTKEFNLHTNNGSSRGIWSDGTYIWVVDSTDTYVYAYNLSTGARETSQEFNLHSDIGSPRGIWGNNNYIWIADSSDRKLYAHNKGNKSRSSSQDIDLNSNNSNAEGIWSNETYIWVVDSSDRKLYAYNLSTGNRDTTKEFYLHSSNTSEYGIWSDGTYIWVVDSSDRKLYTYVIDPSFSISHSNTNNDFETLSAAGNNDPVSVTSDVNNLYVADGTDNKIYTYNINTKVRTPLLDVRNYAGSAMKGITLTDGNLLIADSSTDKIYGYSNFFTNTIINTLKSKRLIT